MADAAGFDHLWLFDHLLPIHQELTEEIHDGWTCLGRWPRPRSERASDST